MLRSSEVHKRRERRAEKEDYEDSAVEFCAGDKGPVRELHSSVHIDVEDGEQRKEAYSRLDNPKFDLLLQAEVFFERS